MAIRKSSILSALTVHEWPAKHGAHHESTCPSQQVLTFDVLLPSDAKASRGPVPFLAQAPSKSFRSSRLVPPLLTCCECLSLFFVPIPSIAWNASASSTDQLRTQVRKRRQHRRSKQTSMRSKSEWICRRRERRLRGDPRQTRANNVEWATVDSSSKNRNGNVWTESTPAKETDRTGTSARGAPASEKRWFGGG